ncbi:MAG: type II toxin-antitoxin system HicA family toxin [Rhodoferax sp.]|nr:type II toxin-antitoxin system HicA family toxin [Rhodoferax sp.]
MPANGSIEWSRIESLLASVGCVALAGSGSSVMFERDGEKVYFHRPHPGKEALRYRVIAARDFLLRIGEIP